MTAVGQGHGFPGARAAHQGGRPRRCAAAVGAVWGGPNVLAQALWKVRETRSPESLQKFVAKLRVYTISDQDDSGPWIRKNFPGTLLHREPRVPRAAAPITTPPGRGISGDNFHGRFAGADFYIVDNPWLDEHIRAKARSVRNTLTPSS